MDPLYDQAPEISAQYEINDEVHGSIEDKGEVVEAGEAEEPGGWSKGRTAPTTNCLVR